MLIVTTSEQGSHTLFLAPEAKMVLVTSEEVGLVGAGHSVRYINPHFYYPSLFFQCNLWMRFLIRVDMPFRV